MIRLFSVNMPNSVDQALLRTLHSGYITQGPKVEEFEKAVGDYLGTDNVVSLNSGTSALTLALRLAGVGPGDEVITTPMTCTATNLPVLGASATPVFCDVDPITGNMNAESIEPLITNKTKAILFVDWGGLPADLDQIMSIADSHNLKVIEDAAHAFGAEYRGVKVGTIADYTCFSLQAIKHMTTGDGGLLTLKDPSEMERAKRLRWFGIDRKSDGLESRIEQDITEWGYKFHMNDLAATIGIEQMKIVQSTLAHHRVNAKYYDGILDKYFVRMPANTDRKSASWLYTILLPSSEAREEFKDFMQQAGIEVSQVHKRNDQYTVFKKYSRDLDGLDYFADRMICIPVHGQLAYNDVVYIADTCNRFAKERS